MAKHLQNRRIEYTGTSNADLDYTIHECNSTSAFTLTVGDGELEDRITIVNKGAGDVTLSGNISTTTATTILYTGESIELSWDSAEWI